MCCILLCCVHKIFIVSVNTTIQMNVYIKVINLKNMTCFDTYYVIIRCRLMLRCRTCTQYGSILWVNYVLYNITLVIRHSGLCTA
jgi:hypothetical protein